MNKQDLINNLVSADPASLNKSHAEAVVNTVFAHIATALARGEKVRITGFGTFRRMTTKARTGRNPRTGEAVEIPARNRAKFKAPPNSRCSHDHPQRYRNPYP